MRLTSNYTLIVLCCRLYNMNSILLAMLTVLSHLLLPLFFDISCTVSHLDLTLSCSLVPCSFSFHYNCRLNMVSINLSLLNIGLVNNKVICYKWLTLFRVMCIFIVCSINFRTWCTTTERITCYLYRSVVATCSLVPCSIFFVYYTKFWTYLKVD